MAVTSQELRDGKPVEARRQGLRAPLNRSDLDRAAPWLRLLAGAALIAWSSYTTIQGIGVDFAPFFVGQSVMAFGVSAHQLIAGLVFAALLSLIEWLTSERMLIVYCAALLIDARYTQWQIGPFIQSLAQYHVRLEDPVVALIASFIVSWGLSLAIARYGELLLFGRRGQKD